MIELKPKITAKLLNGGWTKITDKLLNGGWTKITDNLFVIVSII
jgi:hypothetical protein